MNALECLKKFNAGPIEEISNDPDVLSPEFFRTISRASFIGGYFSCFVSSVRNLCGLDAEASIEVDNIIPILVSKGITPNDFITQNLYLFSQFQEDPEFFEKQFDENL